MLIVTGRMTHGMTGTTNTNRPDLCMFPVDAIYSSCIAVPYDCTKDTTNSIKWLIFESKDDWYNKFLDIIKKHLQNNDED